MAEPPDIEYQLALKRAAHRLMEYNRLRVYRWRLKYPNNPHLRTKPRLLLSPEGESYIEIMERLARLWRVRLNDHGSAWEFCLKAPVSKTLPAHKAAHYSNIRLASTAPNQLPKQTAVASTDVLRLLLRLRHESLLLHSPGKALSARFLSDLARKMLGIPHNRHVITSILLGVELMGFRLSDKTPHAMILDCSLGFSSPVSKN